MPAPRNAIFATVEPLRYYAVFQVDRFSGRVSAHSLFMTLAQCTVPLEPIHKEEVRSFAGGGALQAKDAYTADSIREVP